MENAAIVCSVAVPLAGIAQGTLRLEVDKCPNRGFLSFDSI